MITTTIRITLNLDQNDACLILAFFRNLVKASLTLSNIATYSAMGFFVYSYASRRALNSLSNESCHVDAKLITTTIRITLNLDQNDVCLILAFFRNLVKPGLILFNIAIYSAMGFYILICIA